jgi:hypothetical protein
LAPKVISVEGNLELDDIIRVEVAHLDQWVTKNDASKLVPYLNGLAIHGNYPEETMPVRTIAPISRIRPQSRQV